MQQTYDLLSHLGAASSYKGYHYLAYIIDRIVAQNNEPTPFRTALPHLAGFYPARDTYISESLLGIWKW